MIHGSPIQGLKILLPKFSRFRKIFGTTDEQIAARYMADGDSHRLIDSIRFLLNSDGKKLLNQKGSIYTLSPRDFKLDPHKGKLDWVYSTDIPQRVLYERKFDSVLQELNNRHIISVPPKYSKAFLQKDVSPTLLKDLIENQTYMLKQGNKSMGKFFELYKEADFMVSDKNNNEKYVNSYGVYIGTANDPEVAKGKFNALMKKHKKLSIARKEYEKENPDDYVTAAGKYGPKNDKLKVKVRIGKIDSDGQKEFYKELFKTASKKEQNKPSPVAREIVLISKRLPKSKLKSLLNILGESALITDKVVDIDKPMQKLAFKWSNISEPIKDYFKHTGVAGAAVPAGMAGLGSLLGYHRVDAMYKAGINSKNISKKKRDRDKKLGATFGGLYGGLIGSRIMAHVYLANKNYDRFKGFKNNYRNYDNNSHIGYSFTSLKDLLQKAELSGNTKAELIRAYKEKMKAIHPDKFLDPIKKLEMEEKAKILNNIWDKIKNTEEFQKMASWRKTAEVVKDGDVFKVYSKKGKLFGTYKTEAEAKKRMRQMEAFKHMKKIAESNIAIDLLSGADPTGRATLEISKGNKKNSLLRGTAAAIGGFTAGSLATNAITGGGLLLAGKLTKNPQLKKILNSSGRSMLLLFNPKKTIKTLKQFNEAQKLVTKDIKAFKNLKNLYSKYEPTISHIKANSLTAIDDIPVNKILADKSKIKTMGKSLEKQFKASNEFERKYGKTHGVAFSDGAGLIAGLASSGIGGAMNAISAGSQYQAGQQYRKDIAKIKAK